MLPWSEGRAHVLCAIPTKSRCPTWSGVHELSEEECLQRLFQSCTNKLYDKHHDVSLDPFSLRSITHLRKNQAVLNGSGRPCNTPPINSPSVEGKVNFYHVGLTKCAIYCKKMFLFLFLFFPMLLLFSFFRLKELFQVKNGLTKSLLFSFFGSVGRR